MTRKIRVFFTAALVVSALSSAAWAQATTPPAGSPVDRHGALRVEGNKIVGSKHGNPVALRGMSFFWNIPGWNQAGYYTADVVNTLADDWKVDVVRVAISPARDDKSGATNELGNNNWKTVVAAAKAKGLYVIVDFHAHNKSLKDEAVSFFSGLSKNADYKNVPNIIYEIFNEPCATTNSQNGGGGCGGDNWATDIKPYATAVVDAIRGQQDTNIIIIGTPNFSKRVDEASASPVTGKNLVYALHYYTGHVPTTGDPDGVSSEHRARLRGWASQALSRGSAIFVSEFGISQPGGGLGTGENNTIDTVEARKWFDFLDENTIGWANWTISNKAEAASALSTGGGGGGWTTGTANCNAFNGTTRVEQCSNHGNLRCSGSWIRTKLRYYGTAVTLSATSTGAGQGSVSTTPPAPFYPWQKVSLKANPQSGSRFEGWSSGVTGSLTDNPKTITITGNTSVEAVFFPENQIKNSTFTASSNDWVTYPGSGSATAPEVAYTNGEFVVTMPSSVGSDPSAVRVQHQGTSLTKGRKYKLTFDARASAARTIQAAYRTGNTSSGHKFNIGSAVSLTSGMVKDIELEFNMNEETTTSGFIAFYLGGQPGNVTFDNVKLVDAGAGTSAAPQAVAAHGRVSWSVAQAGGALRLRGPAEAGSRVSLYDTRGKMIRSANAADGMTFAVGVPAGNYIVVVKNRAGSEVMKARVSLVK